MVIIAAGLTPAWQQTLTPGQVVAAHGHPCHRGAVTPQVGEPAPPRRRLGRDGHPDEIVHAQGRLVGEAVHLEAAPKLVHGHVWS